MGRQTARTSNQFVATEKGNRSNINIAKNKPSQTLSAQGTLGISGSKPLGSIGGVNITQTASLDLGSIVGPQGLIVGANPVEKSLTLGVAGGISKFLGGEASVTIEPGGFLGAEITGVSFGVNVLGFGASAENDGSNSSSFSISAFGGKIAIGSHEDGTTSVSIGISLPGFETGITFQPDGTIVIPFIPPSSPDGIGVSPDDIGDLSADCAYFVAVVTRVYYIIDSGFISYQGSTNYFQSYGQTQIGKGTADIGRVYNCGFRTSKSAPNGWGCDVDWIVPPGGGGYSEVWTPAPRVVGANFERFSWQIGSRIETGRSLQQTWIPYWKGLEARNGWKIFIHLQPLYGSCAIAPTPDSDTPILQIVGQNLPNYPQNYKRMDCCEQVKEIYKYLGIAKMKKKFKVAKQFLAPGGQGNEECEDYYALSEALFRMLANGLIINPISKPLGSEWKSVNATAWAGQMYEMTAEAMSNGDSTQKYEIAAIMQQVQLMSAVAELSRKVDFLQEAIGHLPDLGTEEVPVCFTIHESHKGFGKKEKEVIDITAPKTDADVEKVLGKMLRPSKIPIVRWEFKPGAISIASALNKL